ncbi:MAG: Mcm2-7 hexameric complex component [Chaenotheca gracillima]|nr:MAG: Mcm2-7 hexameric complex component [Chaenotheca gracillima]
MATGEPLAPASDLASQADPPAQRGNRRSRGPGGRGRGRNANNSRKKAGDSSATASDQEQPAGSSLTFRPASVPPPVQPHSARNTNQSEQATLPNGHDHGSSRGRGGSGRSQAQNPAGSSRQARDRPRGERGKRHPNATSSRLPDGRSFGGQLTTQQRPSELPGMDSALHGGAAEFRPGQPVSQESVRSNQKPPSDRPTRGPARKRRPSKSTAQDIATRTHEDISSGLYECPIFASRNGRKTRALHRFNRNRAMCLFKGCGDVLAAIFLKTSYRTHILAGVQRKPTLEVPQDCLPIHVDKPVEKPG